MNKKILFCMLFVFLSVSLFSADQLRNFEIILGGPGTITAGGSIAITITAYDTEGDQMMAGTGNPYYGHVTITASVGGIFLNETGNNTTGAFDSNGRWTGVMQIRGAGDPVTLAVADASGATGTAVKTVTAGNYNPGSGEGRLLVLVEGMDHAPGTLSGYTGAAVTQTIDVPLAVTVYACDDWCNIASVIANPSNVEVYTGVSETVVPSQVNMADASGNTSFVLTIHQSQSVPTVYNITANDKNSTGSDTVGVIFVSLTDFYVWAKVKELEADPQLAVKAGQPIAVTVTISNFPPSDTSGGVSGLSEIVQIKAVNDSDRSDAVPGLTPQETPQMSTSNGIAVFTAAYTRRSSNLTGDIRIQANCLTKVMANASDNSRDSSVILVYADDPDTYDFTSSASQLTKGGAAALSVSVYDQYANAVSNTAVDFAIVEGGGTLNTGTVNTDFYGLAQVTFNAPADNLNNIIRAEVAGITGYQYVTITSTLSTEFTNWPNPFNPAREDTKIHYFLEQDSSVELRLYSMFGKLVWSKDIEKGEIENGEKHGAAGGNTVTWNGTADGGYTVGAGLYVLRMKIGNNIQTRKIAIVK